MDSAETQIQARRRDTRYVFMMFEFGMHHESHGSKAAFAKKKKFSVQTIKMDSANY
jgi:hypothetical protein